MKFVFFICSPYLPKYQRLVLWLQSPHKQGHQRLSRSWWWWQWWQWWWQCSDYELSWNFCCCCCCWCCQAWTLSHHRHDNHQRPELELIEWVFVDVVKLEVHLGSKVNQIAQVSELVICVSWPRFGWKWQFWSQYQIFPGRSWISDIFTLLHIKPLEAAAAVYLVCSRFLHLRSFANPQNPASYIADREPAKRRATNHLKTFFGKYMS